MNKTLVYLKAKDYNGLVCFAAESAKQNYKSKRGNNMKDELFFYDIYPKVLKSDCETEVTIKALLPDRAFHDDEEYTIKVLDMTADYYSDTKAAVFETVVRPKNGALVFKCRYNGEQEHSVRIFKKDGEAVAYLPVYSLKPDLMELTPLMGDFHVHTSHSDGRESPEFVSAMYRQQGFDFAPITDHGMFYPSQESIDFYKGLDLDFKIYHGEEVHTPKNHVHIINFGGDYSVNELAKINTNELWSCNPRPEWVKEAEDLAATLPNDLEPGVDKFVLASCMLAFKKIREANGMCIFCHPHWIANVYHISDSLSKYLLENNLPDAFELIGGQSNRENMMQIALWEDIRANGHKVNVVGSSDSHGTVNRDLFNRMKTIVFAKANTRDDIINAVKSGYSVALFDRGEELVQMYADYRLTSYAMFLYHYYFPLHNELCYEEGRLMRAYLGGDKSAADRLKSLKGQTGKLIEKLFDK